MRSLLISFYSTFRGHAVRGPFSIVSIAGYLQAFVARVPLGLAVAACCLVFMIATEPYLAIVWDEGYTLGREEAHSRLVPRAARSGDVRGAMAATL